MHYPSVVPGSGPAPCRVMIVGERPGYEEAQAGIPFAGTLGREQDLFLNLNGLHRAGIYITNLVKSYDPDNADPTPADIREWGPVLEQELRDVQPQFVLSVGRFATRWFLGAVDMEAVHGTPRRSDKTNAVIIPAYHPMFGIYDPDAKGLVYHDYKQAALIIKGKISSEPVVDAYAHPGYLEIDDPRRIAIELRNTDVCAIDTEGVPNQPWSFQFSSNPGTGIVVRASSRWFRECAAVVRRWIADADPLVIVHNAMYDLGMMRAMGCDISNARLYDTMVAAYLLRLEPQSLKHLARRHCGMEMMEYREVIGDAADHKREEYLWSILEHEWPKPGPRVVVENDLTTRVYKPRPIVQSAESILLDWSTARDNLQVLGRFVVKLGAKEEFNVAKRFNAIDSKLHQSIEAVLGPFPNATLADIPLEKAITYSGRDSDATLRVYSRIAPIVAAAGLDDRMTLIMFNIPSIEEMQSTGFIASRSKFEALNDRMASEMHRICSELSFKFNGGHPINPNSGDQVASLMARRGLQGLKRSKITRKVSTAKKSIEHLRFIDPAIGLVEDWRERAKTRDSFTDPILARCTGDSHDHSPIRCNLRVTRVSSSRLSASDPPLLAIPVRHDLGIAVRSGFVAPDAQDLIDHYGVELENAHDTYLGSWDMSQIEMRIAAHLSRDPLLCQLFHERRDIHAETAIKIFGLPDIRERDVKGNWVYPSVDKMKHRNPTKRAGFGVLTAISGAGLLDQLRMMGCEGWDEGSCDELIEDWFKIYPLVRTNVIQACRAECRAKGYVRDMGGLPRYLPGIWSKDGKISAEAGRQSHSHVIQGSAQWLIQRAMSWLKPQIIELRDSSGLWLRWVLQIHDELIFAYDQRLEPVLEPLVIEALCEHSYKLRVPVEANHSYGLDWGALK